MPEQAWHPDPSGRHQHRYWDGEQWTEHVANNGVTGTDPVTAAQASTSVDDEDVHEGRVASDGSTNGARRLADVKGRAGQLRNDIKARVSATRSVWQPGTAATDSTSMARGGALEVVDAGTANQSPGSDSESELTDGPQDQLVPEPEPRLIRSPTDAEEVAAEWMCYFGFIDATTTRAGADGGIDVTSEKAVAQVKAHMSPIGRPDLQKLHGVATAERKMAVFFSLMDYTPPAREWADAVGMAIFRFDLSGRPEPVNDAAAVLAGDGGSSSQGVAAAVADPRPVWEFPEVCGDDRAIKLITREARPVLGRPEIVTWIRKCWLELLQLEVEFTRREGRRRVLTLGSSAPVFESISGSTFSLRARGCVPVPAARNRQLVRSRASVDVVVDSVLAAWSSHARRPVASQAIYPPRLSQAGILADVEKLTSVRSGHRLALPLFVALLQTGSSRRLVCVDGLDGSRRSELDTVFTENLTSLVTELEAS